MSKNEISVKDLTVAYQGKTVLNHVSTVIQAQKFTGIIGPNGAGKSTFMKALLELVPKISGEVTFDGRSIKTIRKKIAYVEQRSELDLSFPIDVLGVVLLGTYPSLRLGQRPGKKKRNEQSKP